MALTRKDILPIFFGLILVAWFIYFVGLQYGIKTGVFNPLVLSAVGALIGIVMIVIAIID